MNVRVPSDSTTISLGADAIAGRLRETHPDINVQRNGSRGAAWLEPLVELETADGWLGFANGDATSIDGILKEAAGHASCIGAIDEHPFFAKQQRFTFSRIGQVDPLSVEDYAAARGLSVSGTL